MILTELNDDWLFDCIQEYFTHNVTSTGWEGYFLWSSACTESCEYGVVSKFLLKNNLATFATSDKKWNTLAIVAEGPIFAIYCSYCTQIYSDYGLHFTRTYAKVVNISSFIEWYLMNKFFFKTIHLQLFWLT